LNYHHRHPPTFSHIELTQLTMILLVFLSSWVPNYIFIFMISSRSGGDHFSGDPEEDFILVEGHDGDFVGLWRELDDQSICIHFLQCRLPSVRGLHRLMARVFPSVSGPTPPPQPSVIQVRR